MSQIVDLIITSGIPDREIESSLESVLSIYDDCFVKVLYGDSVVLLTNLGSTLQECFD